MSVLACQGGCGRYIDTDFDVESWESKTERFLCEVCMGEFLAEEVSRHADEKARAEQ